MFSYFHRSSKDHFQVLGVSYDCSNEDIKNAYYTLALKYHPDHNKGFDAEKQFRDITKSYEAIKNEQQRKIYLDQISLRNNDFEKYSKSSSKYQESGYRKTYHTKTNNKNLFAFERFVHPKNLILIVLPVFCLTYYLHSVISPRDPSNYEKYKHGNNHDLVDAWFNKTTNRWETPSPWNPEFRGIDIARDVKKVCLI